MLRFSLIILSVFSFLRAEDINRTELLEMIEASQNFLLSKQEANGAFAPKGMFTLGISAMVTEAILDAPNAVPMTDERMKKAYAYLMSKQKKDGGFYDKGLGNYCTSLVLMAMATADSKDTETIKKAHNYLLGIQNKDESSDFYGGIGYGRKGKGHEDLNNTSFAIEALSRSGMSGDNPAMQRAMKFLEKCQNLSSHNKTSIGQNGNSDGGAYYSPDVSKAGGSYATEKGKAAAEEQIKKGALNSYGTMTYALVSSYLSLNLKKDDPRVAAALDWSSKNYCFDKNPGMAEAQKHEGHYYYLTLMAKTYSILEQEKITLAGGKKVDWKKDLFKAIKEYAKVTTKDGKKTIVWINDNASRWAEGNVVLTTTYMLKTLKRIQKSIK